jgi:hypothetical protein
MIPLKNKFAKEKSDKRYSLILESSKTNYINLDNLGTEDTAVVGQLTVDTRRTPKAKIQLSFNCNLDYSMSLTEQMNLLFKLYRKDSKGTMTELASQPYVVILTGELGTEAEFVTISLAKNETLTMNYLDETIVGDLYTYLVEVSLIYSSVDVSSIQSGTITAIGKAYKDLNMVG